MLKKFIYDVEIDISDRNKKILREFISRNAQSIKRIYAADYSNASLKAMLGMLGFSYRPVFGAASPRALRIIELFCYESNYTLLNELVRSFDKRSDMCMPIERPSSRINNTNGGMNK